MKICVCGWYYYDEFYKSLGEIRDKYDVTIIAHNDNKDKLDTYGIPYIIKENVGLEFGAYDYYLKNVWDRESSVLFIHDDAAIKDLIAFDKVAELDSQGIDQAYIFKSEAEQVNNGGKHGRAIFISKKLLTFMVQYECKCEQSVDHYDSHNPDTVLLGTPPHTGFWFDHLNKGHSNGKPPKGVRHYNEMIYHFHRYLGRVRDKRFGNEQMDVLHRVIIPEIDCARRGQFRIERIKNEK